MPARSWIRRPFSRGLVALRRTALTLTLMLALLLVSDSTGRGELKAECVVWVGTGLLRYGYFPREFLRPDGSIWCIPAGEPLPLKVPIAEKIARGEIVARAVPFVQLPQVGDLPARVRQLVPLRDGSGRLAILDQEGRVYLTDAEGRSLSLYLDIVAADVGFQVIDRPRPETGLLGIAFHPDFAVRHAPGYGKFYTSYSATTDSGVADWFDDGASNHEDVLREWTATDPGADQFAGTSREILRVGKTEPIHEIGKVAFNPRVQSGHPDYGMLYVGFGDDSWGRATDHEHAQNLRSPLGAMLRIDPLNGGGRQDTDQLADDDGRGYGIPADNPFVGRDDALPEIWAWGLRHPQHFSWDIDGRLFLIDIGHLQIEEVNLGIAGANYGWPLREGTFATWRIHEHGSFGGVYPRPESDETDYVYPIAQYDHDEGIRGVAAIGNSFVYRGQAIPALRGKLVLVDIPSGRLFYADADGLAPNRQQTLFELLLEFPEGFNSLIEAGAAGPQDPKTDSRPRADARLGMDAAGELYLLTKGDGMVRRLVAPIGAQQPADDRSDAPDPGAVEGALAD